MRATTLREKRHDRSPRPVRHARLVTTFESDIADVTVRGRALRVAVRPAKGAGPARTALLLMNGIGAGLDVLDPLVEQLPPNLEVIRFDVPGVGGSPTPVLPYTYAMLASRIGVVAWPSSSPRPNHDGVDGWCSRPPVPAPSWFPHAPASSPAC